MAKPVVFLHRRAIFWRGTTLLVPQSFRHPLPIKPTPGGRYKVRKLTNGAWRVYTDSGLPNRKYRLDFPNWDVAFVYANTLATIAHLYPNDRDLRSLSLRSEFLIHTA